MGTIRASTAIADLDGDDELEIVVSNAKEDTLYCLNNDGSLLWELANGSIFVIDDVFDSTNCIPTKIEEKNK